MTRWSGKTVVISLETADGSRLRRKVPAFKSKGSRIVRVCKEDLDGFFTFAIGTRNGFAVIRDPIACKPAILAETDDYVAMASEYQALSSLPGIENARIWEPAPATLYIWERPSA